MAESLSSAESDERSTDMEGGPRKHYKKTSGFSGYRGEAFELNLCALIYARALNSALRFRMASNMKELQIFDDIALQLHDVTKIAKQTYFIQVKNKKKSKISEQLLLKHKGDFSLHQYYSSYIDIQEKFESKEICPWFDGQLKDCLFILYTNADIDKSIQVAENNDECLEIILTDDSHCRVLKFNDKDHGTIYEALKDKPKYREFFSQMRIVYKQANEKDMEQFIMTEIKLNTSISHIFIKSTYREYMSLLEQWWIREKKASFLDESKNLLSEASDAVELIELLDRRKSELEKLGLTFHESSLQRISEKIENSKITLIFSVGRSAAPTAVRINQILRGRSYSILNAQDVVTRRKEVLLAWEKGYFDILVIEDPNTFDTVDDIYIELKEKVNEEPNLRKIIFISALRGEEEQTYYLRSVFGESLEEIFDSWNISTLVEFRSELYLQKKVLFQGKKMTLSQLLGSPHTEILNCLDQESTSLLLVNEIPEVGVAIEEELEYYIERTLSKDCAADGSTVEWRPSSLLEGEDRIVIVAAEPGMGKSTLLTSLANETKKKHPDVWVVRININDYTMVLNNIKSNKGKRDCATEILNKASRIERPGSTNLESQLLNLACMHTGNMVVLVDGADEVCPHYMEEFFHLLRSLCKTKVRKIWITARPNLTASLETVLTTHSYFLTPFSDADQKLFLKKFWKNKTVDVNDEVLDVVANHVIELAKKQLIDNDRHFMGIALQSQVLAEIFQYNLTLEVTRSIMNINFFKLYELYTEKKWNIYLTEKKKDDVTNVNVRCDNEKLYIVFIESHMTTALFHLLPEEELKKLGIVSKGKSVNFEESEYIEKKGVITGILNGRPQFVHKTFEDFFIAKWLHMHLDQSIQFLCDHITDPKYKIVRNILDYMLVSNGDLLHNAILNGNSGELLSRIDVDCQINQIDDGGRTVLHLSVMYGLRDVIHHLLEHGADYTLTDRVLGWSPLEYAFKMGHWQVFTHHLVKHRVLLSPCNSSGETILHMAAANGIVEFFNFVDLLTDLNNERMPIDARNENFETPLLEAVQRGHTQVVHFLVKRGAGIGVKRKEDGKSVSQISRERGYTEIVKIFNERIMGKIYDFPKQHTDLHKCAESGELGNVEELLEEGFPVDCIDHQGRTALWCAAAARNVRVLECLVESGCGIDILGPERVTAIDSLIENEDMLEAVDILVRNGATLKPDTVKNLQNSVNSKSVDDFTGIMNVIYGDSTGTKNTDIRKWIFIFESLVDPLLISMVILWFSNFFWPPFLIIGLLDNTLFLTDICLLRPALSLNFFFMFCNTAFRVIKYRYYKLYKTVGNYVCIEHYHLKIRKLHELLIPMIFIIIVFLCAIPVYFKWLLWRIIIVLQHNGQLSGFQYIRCWSWSEDIRLHSK